MIHVAEPRSRAYLELLAWGLLAARDRAYAGRADLCAIEADHIHNMPSLIGEPNERRHLYYIVQERGLFLQRLDELGDTEYIERRVISCSEP